MMNDDGLPPPDPAATWQRIRLIWSLSLLTPILYLILARVMQHYGWIETFPQARHPWDFPAARVSIAAVSALLLLALVWLRVRRPRIVQKLSDDSALALRGWVLNFYFMAAISEILAFMGLVYLIISGHMWAVLAGGAAAYLGYALAYPARKELVMNAE